MADLNEILEGNPESSEQATASAEPGATGDTSVAGEVRVPEDGATPGAEEETGDRTVPLAALLDERGKRQDERERASQLEARLLDLTSRLDAISSQRAAPSDDEPFDEGKFLEDPGSVLAAMDVKRRKEQRDRDYAVSERLAKHLHGDYKDVIGRYREACNANPTLSHAVHQDDMPALLAYDQTKAWIEAQKPSAADAKVVAAEAELMKLREQIESLTTGAGSLRVPQPLGSARGSGVPAPGAAVYTTPSMDDILA